MGTFHQNMGELHGITVVVDTKGPQLVIGRCHEMTEKGILLHDVDIHVEGENGLSKEDYLKRAAKFGIWKKHQQWIVPQSEIASVRRLGEIPV